MKNVNYETEKDCDFIKLDVEKFDQHSARGIEEEITKYLIGKNQYNQKLCLDLSEKGRYVDQRGMNSLTRINKVGELVGYKILFLLLDPNKGDAIERMLVSTKKDSLFKIIHSNDEINF